MMTQLFLMITKMIIGIMKWLVIGIVIVSIPFVISALIHLAIYYKRGMRFKRRKVLSTYSKPTFLKRLFVDAPKRFILDRLERNPDEFPYCGNVMICGEQGSGKSLTTVFCINALKQMYPNVKVLSNMPLSLADGEITSPDDIILNDNGIYGTIKVLDEIQNWFNSLESANFPPEMLSEVSQQRKQHSLLIGTSQQFMRVSKAIREQTHYLLKPLTIAGCVTVIRVYKPKIAEDGSVEKMRWLKNVFFVHTDELRNSYDTYAKIKRMTMKGWKPRAEQLQADSPAPAIQVDIKEKNKRK